MAIKTAHIKPLKTKTDTIPTGWSCWTFPGHVRYALNLELMKPHELVDFIEKVTKDRIAVNQDGLGVIFAERKDVWDKSKIRGIKKVLKIHALDVQTKAVGTVKAGYLRPAPAGGW